MFRYITILLISLIGVTELDSQRLPPEKESPIPSFNKTEQRLAKMTLREKVAQMIISNSNGYSLEKNSKEYKRLKTLITQEKIGGLIFFKGNAYEEAGLINEMQELSETPLLISADFERGTGMRLDDGSIFPNNMALGATRNPDLAYKMGLEIAKECRALGIHQNYAPVLDINNNPKNPIINVRSFGEDAELVSEMGLALIKGIQDGKVIATAKHFPGHGDTDIDSHNDLPVINYGKDRLEKTELVPFRNAIEKGVMSVMIAHLSFPSIDSRPDFPSSLSDKIVNDILIDELGFKGLIVTDALNMAGVVKHFSTEEVATYCVDAGIDLILMPQGEKKTIDAIVKAVKSGQIDESRIDRSVKKILDAKEWLGLFENKTVNLSQVMQNINNDDAKFLSKRIAEESVTLVKNEGEIPFGRRMIARESCMLISLNNTQDRKSPDYFLQEFGEAGKKLYGVYEVFDIDGEVTNLAEILDKAKNFNNIVIPVYAKVRIKTGTVGIPQSQIDLINSLVENGSQVTVVSLGNPYLIQGFKKVTSYICAYGDGQSSIKACIDGMFGMIPFKGTLPVTISDEYKAGTGIK